MKPLIFLGSRMGMAQLATVAEDMGYQIEGILDFQYHGNTDRISNIPVIGNDLWLMDKENTQAQEWLNGCDFFVADYFGGSKTEMRSWTLRKRRIQMLEELGIDSPNLIHPSNNLAGLTSKYTDGSLKIGKGNFFDEDVVIHQDNVTIGDYCCLTWGSRVSHGSIVGNNVIFCPNTFYQFCNIGNDVFLGMNSKTKVYSIDKKINIGNNAIIWAEACIKNDIPNDSILTSKGRIVPVDLLY